MASARSTVSIARTTPAQKPRGEHNMTFSCGFLEGREDVMSFRGFSDQGQNAKPRDSVTCAPLSSTRAAERQKFRCDHDKRAGRRRGSEPPGAWCGGDLQIYLYSQHVLNIGLRKPGRRAYISIIPVIFDGNRLRPAGRAERKENLPWRPSL